MYSWIFELYHQWRSFEKAVYIDLFDDIIFSYWNLQKSFSKIEEWLNGLRKVYKSQWSDVKNIGGDITWIITYRKNNTFNDDLLGQMILRNEDELLQVRMFRVKLIKELLKTWLVKESVELKDNNDQTFFDEFDDLWPWLKYFTKFNNKWEISISFDKIKEENWLITIWRKKFYIQDPKNIWIFLGITILKWIVEFYSVQWFNKYLRAWYNWELEEEDMEFLFINFQIAEIEKIRKELLDSDTKKTIQNYDFRLWKLYINGERFQLNEKAIKASSILLLLSEYFETYKGRSMVRSDELKIFLSENKKRYPSLTEDDLEIEKLRTGFFRTFEDKLHEKYKFNNILGRDKEHVILLGKVS